MGTHQADLIQSLLSKLFPSAPLLLHARSCHRRTHPLRVSLIEQPLGGNCCRFCLSRCTGADTAATGCNSCCLVVYCSSCARRSGRVDFEPQGFGRRRVCTALSPCISKI